MCGPSLFEVRIPGNQNTGTGHHKRTNRQIALNQPSRLCGFERDGQLFQNAKDIVFLPFEAIDRQTQVSEPFQEAIQGDPAFELGQQRPTA